MAKAAGAHPQTIDLAPLTLRADVETGSVNRAARTINLVFSTGAPVLRYDWMSDQKYMETLSLKPGAVRLDRLNSGAPFLNAHSTYDIEDVLGVVVDGSAKVSGSEARATVRLSKRDDVEPIWQDLQDGILRNVSVGYRVHKYEQTEASEGSMMMRLATDWEPYEISAVPIGADAGAQVRAEDKKRIATNPCVIVTRATSGAREEYAMKTVCLDCRAEFTEPLAVCSKCQSRNLKPQDPPAPVVDPADPGAPMKAAQPARVPATDSERQAGIEVERTRVQGIILAVRNAGFPSTVADQYIGDATMSLERAQTAILTELGKLDRDGPRPGGVAIREVGGVIREVGDPGIHVRSGIENALLHRVAPEFFKLDEMGRSYAGSSLLELARYCLQARGIRTTGMSKMEVAGLAMGLHQRGAMHTTSDFAYILEDVANKTLRRAYDEAPQTFSRIARRVELPDFKPVRRTQLGDAPQLAEVLEHGEFTRGTIGNAKETYQLRTWGKVFGITRQALVNDDTDAFGRLALMFGRMARHKESDLIWEQITSNPAMGDTNALFSAAHSNVSTGAAVISVATISAGRAGMRKQTGLDGVAKLNISARYLLVPVAIETTADQFVSTALLASQSSNVNPFAGRLEVIAEPRLDDVSESVWYLAASPDQLDMVEYGFLAGENGPVVETRVGFDVDGLEVKCRHDVAAKVIDWRGFWRNAA